MASIMSNGGYNSPELAAVATNLASMFAPPSASELAGYSTARKNNQQSDIVAKLAQNPEHQSFDHQAILADLYDPTASFKRVEMDNQTQRYGYDTQAETSRANNLRDNQRQIALDRYGTADPHHSAPVMPGDIAGMFSMPELPARVGAPKPMSETEAIAAGWQEARDNGGLSPEEWEAIMKGSDDSAAEERIGRMTDNLMRDGTVVDPEEARAIAVGIVDGRLKDVRDPVTGEVQIIDMATGLPAYSQDAPSTSGDPVIDAVMAPDQPQFGEQYPAADQSFGVGGALAGGINTALDTLGVGAPYKDIQQTQADFGVLRESLLNDMAGAYGRQPPSWLLEEIRNLTPAAGNALEGTGSAVSKLNAIGRHLTSEMQLTEQALQRRLGPTQQQEMEARMSGLQAGVARVQQALEAFGGQEAQPDQDGWITMPNGVRIREVQ